MSEIKNDLDQKERTALATVRRLGVKPRLLIAVTNKLKKELGTDEGQRLFIRAARFLDGFALYLGHRLEESESMRRQLNEVLGGIFQKINGNHTPLQKLGLLLNYFDHVAEFDGRFLPRRPIRRSKAEKILEL